MGKHAKRITINNENGDLVILGKYTERVKYSTGTQNKIAIACIRCYCGNVFETQMKHIMSRNTKSCGCYRRLVASKNSMKHGMAYTNTYSSWENFMKCVNNKNDPSYPTTGARGIKVCDKWLTFESFLKYMGVKPPGHRLNRIDKDGDFEPDNCEWVRVKRRKKLEIR